MEKNQNCVIVLKKEELKEILKNNKNSNNTISKEYLKEYTK